MKLLRIIRALLLGRAAGGEVRPIDHGNDIPAVLSSGYIEDIDPRVRAAVGDDL